MNKVRWEDQNGLSLKLGGFKLEILVKILLIEGEGGFQGALFDI
jgi:hypothetical protein